MTNPPEAGSIKKFSLLSSVWDDIDHEAEAIVVSDITYDPTSLSNVIYKIIDDREQRHKLLKRNKIRGLYADLDPIRQHRDHIVNDPTVSLLIHQLFREEEIPSITPLDRVYVNAYYRRLLRAQIEQNHLRKELVPGLVVTEYVNAETDTAIVQTLRLLRIVCKFLGISSTFQAATIPADKLDAPAFWASVSEKFVVLFGESRIEPIVEPEDMTLSDKNVNEVQVLMFLNVVLNTWCGSTIVLNGKNLELMPATCVMRLLSKLK